MRRTKIVCTIGPASSSQEALQELAGAGMDIARLNCSHGTTSGRVEVLRRLRGMTGPHGRRIAVFLDLRGPRLRVGELPPGGRTIYAGHEIILVTGEGVSAGPAGPAPNTLPVPSPFLAAGVRNGQKIFIDDGNVELEVLDTNGGTIRCRVVRGGTITAHKGINAPGAPLALPILEADDLDDIRITLQEGVDAVAVSFVRTPDDIEQVKAAVHAFRPQTPLIAKLETRQAISNLEGILNACNGIMIARGDLGVELPPEEVPVLQKRLIAAARKHGKPVITATQMLESMVEHERPTRAEASDVANAVFDGTDAVMLSAESSIGNHPALVVETMARIVQRAEQEVLAGTGNVVMDGGPGGPVETVCEAACRAADRLAAKCLVTFTQSGSTAAILSRYRPKSPVIAFAWDEGVRRRLHFYWGVFPLDIPRVENTDALITEMEKRLYKEGLAAPGDTVVIVCGIPLQKAPRANFLKIHQVAASQSLSGS